MPNLKQHDKTEPDHTMRALTKREWFAGQFAAASLQPATCVKLADELIECLNEGSPND